MQPRHTAFLLALGLTHALTAPAVGQRTIEDFNDDWKFHLGDMPAAFLPAFDDAGWRTLRVPHDWSIEQGYRQGEGVSAATGFVPGGIGWYRKHFRLSPEDRGQHIYVAFDGIYNNSSVWLNGQFLGTRPSGFSSFKYDLDNYLNFDGTDNVIAVKVDRRSYADCRWYTGSGIYRKVRLIKTAPVHVAHWGVQITTPEITPDSAEVHVRVKLENTGPNSARPVRLRYSILDSTGKTVAQHESPLTDPDTMTGEARLRVAHPRFWDIEAPNLYRIRVDVARNGIPLDNVTETFGIRTFRFDADTGFWLNGRRLKLKGVNLHHDAGAVGAAVPRALWADRVRRLKSIGVNAIRMSHNPHSVELMEVCDEMGVMVIAEGFDEWDRPKGKSLEVSGDGKATDTLAGRSYSEFFHEWAERDLKDLVRRDRNHPCVIAWSIGNEIEWTFPEYSKVYDAFPHPDAPYGHGPIEYDATKLKAELHRLNGGCDALVAIARKLSGWVREEDPTRPVTSGSVRPSVSLASGYADCVDVLGFNYRAAEYDAAHQHYPDLKILGTENWGAWSEWKECRQRDFVAGIFAWTGFAYLGEAGPWPRKGLEISFFDFAGFKTPRGHFMECLWKDDPKIHIVTTPADESEFSFDPATGWTFTMQMSKPPVWEMLRYWEWYKVYPKWKYREGQNIVVQIYTNCKEAELFLNGKSLGRRARADFPDDNIIKWLVPYAPGELRAVGYDVGRPTAEYTLATHGDPARVELQSTKARLAADGYDVAVLTARLLDEEGRRVTDADREVRFEIAGPVRNLGVDNGWEYNVQPHQTNTVTTHEGRAALFLQSGKKPGSAEVRAVCGDLQSRPIQIRIE